MRWVLAGGLAAMLWAGVGLCAAEARPEAPQARPQAPAAYEVKKTADVKYFEGEGADPERHLLDLYIPQGVKDFPVVVWVHGGGWRQGSKEQGDSFIESFAAHGIGVASVGYRLAPNVQHPRQIEDVARAFAWVHGHIGEHGGDAKRLFVGGISAGGHLSALLALDGKYLKPYGLDPDKDIAGALPVSGVYKLDGHVPFLSGLVANAFGTDEKVQREASPVNQVHAGAPPFYVLYAERDPGVLREQGKDLSEKLKAAGGDVRSDEVPGVGHLTILKGLKDPANEYTVRLVEFVKSHRIDKK